MTVPKILAGIPYLTRAQKLEQLPGPLSSLNKVDNLVIPKDLVERLKSIGILAVNADTAAKKSFIKAGLFVLLRSTCKTLPVITPSTPNRNRFQAYDAFVKALADAFSRDPLASC